MPGSFEEGLNTTQALYCVSFDLAWSGGTLDSMGRVVFFLKPLRYINNPQSFVPLFVFLGTLVNRNSELQKIRFK